MTRSSVWILMFYLPIAIAALRYFHTCSPRYCNSDGFILTIFCLHEEVVLINITNWQLEMGDKH